MGHQDLLPELIRASEAGELDTRLAQDHFVINRELIESLKKEVDYYIRSDARQALKHAELAHRLSLRTEDPLARALGLRAKAQALHVLGRYAEAVELYEQTRRIYHTQNRPVEAARVARALVDALMYLGRYEEALALADEARQTFAANGERLLTAQLETNVGNIHHRLDQYHQALACYERAGAIFAAAGDLTSQAVIAFNSANIHSNLDNFRQAQSLYQLAYELYNAQQMELAATHVRYSLGYLHFLRGEYHQAMHVLSQVREDLLRSEDERMVALCELDLAEVYLQLNVHQEAAHLAARARERFLALEMRYEAAKAGAYQGLACLQRAKLAEAEQALRAAQQEFAEEGNEVYLGLVGIYLADLALKRKEPAEALGHATAAQTLFSRQNLRTKTCYAQLTSAKALMLGGETGRARELGEAVLEASRELDAPWLKYQAHELLGDALLEAGDLDAAREQYAQSVAFIERIRTGIRVDEFRGAFFKDKLRVYEKLIRLCLNQQGTDGQAEAFFYLESCKARTLVDMLINDLEVTPAGDDEAQAELYREWQRLREELHWYCNKTTQHEASGDSRLQAMDGRLREEISARERALTRLAREAQIRDRSFVWLQDSAGLAAAELREALTRDETVIEYYLDADGVKIFVINRCELRVVESACSRKELKAMILELKFQIEKFHYGPDYYAAHQESLLANINACLGELYQALFAPAAPLVEGRKLIFIPFDLLHNVPFQALYDGEEYLLDRHEIAYAPSARLHLLTARRNEREAAAPRALIFGVPDEAAPHITEEINAIRDFFPAARCFTGDEATAGALARHLPASDIAHIASHAVFRQDNPMFSAFKLAGEWLNFYDICSLRAEGALVVLSGCSTGVGGVYAGDEMFGLMRGFLYAGAASLVVSLWAVNDPATAELMTAFYQRLQEGCRPGAALREAALNLKRRYAHPYYWAPFVLIGRNEGFAEGNGASTF
jgi:CHAT domain-containing protein/tetratricopeptide (TPR) repeat protein